MKLSGVNTKSKIENLQLALFSAVQYDRSRDKNIRNFLDVINSEFSLSLSILVSERNNTVSFSSNVKKEFKLTELELYTKLFKEAENLSIKTLKSNQKAYIKLIAELRLDAAKICTVNLEDYVLILVHNDKAIETDLLKQLSGPLLQFSFYLKNSRRDFSIRSSEEIKTFVQNVEGSTLFFSVDGYLLAFNDLAANHFWKVFKIKLKENLSFEEVFDQVDVKQRKKFLVDCLKDKCPKGFEFSFHDDKKNRTFYFDIEYKPFFNDDKEIIGVISSSKEITKFKEEMLRLKEQSATLAAVMEATPDGLLALDLDYNVMFSNFKARKIFKDYRGVDVKTGNNFKEQFTDEEFEARTERIYSRLMKGEELDYTRKVNILDKPHVLNPVHKLIVDEKGASLGYLEYVKDLTELESITSDRNKMNIFLTNIIESSNHSYIAYDLNHKILFFNKVTKKQHRDFFDIELKVGKTIEDVFGEKRFNERYKNVFTKLKNGEEVHTERREFGTGDKKVILDISFSSILDKDGNLEGVLEYTTDITEVVTNSNLLVERTATLNALLDSTEEGIYAVNKNLEIIYSNKQAKKDFKEDLGIDIYEGVNLKDLVDKVTIKRWSESYFDKVFEGEKVKYSGFVAESGSFVENSYIPVKDEKGEILACLEVSKDLTEIREYEQLIKESENQYRILIDAVPTGIAKIDLDGSLSYVSSTAAKMLGDKVSFVLKKSLFDFIVEKDHQKLMDKISLLLEGETEVFSSFQLKSNGKESKHIEGKAKIIRDKDGKPIEYLLAFNDITKRVETQKELISTQDRYEMLFRNMHDAIILYDYKKEKIVDHNDSALKLFKHDKDSITKKTRLDFIPKTSHIFPGMNLHEEVKNHAELVANGQQIYTKGVFLNSENDEVLADVSIVPSDYNKNQAYLVIRDISKQYKAQLELREKSAIYQSILANSFDGIDIIEYKEEDGLLKNGTLLVRNKIMQEIFHNNDLLYDTIDQLRSISPELQSDGSRTEDKLKSNIIELLKNRVVFFEYDAQKPTGEKLYLDTSLSIFNLQDKAYMVRNFKDITQRKKASDIIRKQIEDLNSKNKELQKYIDSNMELENFAYIASHDLKAPIRSVISFMQLLRMNVKDEIAPKNLKFVDIVLEASVNMQVLIDDLLAFSRINTKDVEIERVDVKKMMNSLLNGLSSSIAEKKATINFSDLPEYINADYMRINQVFQNLITNGMKFTEPDVDPVIQVNYIDQIHYHKFSISDNGIGIERDYLDKIFLMFKKLHSENKYQGTGIGLSICKKVIEQHQGNIWVESEPGKGSTFYFTINKELNTTI